MALPPREILITGTLDPHAITTLRSCSELLVRYEPECKRDRLLELIKTATVVISRSETAIDRAVIDQGSLLKVIARAAVGVSNIDIAYATQRGILVVNTPGKNTNSAAELTLGLLLGMLRNLPQAHQHLKNSQWDRHQFVGRELRHKKIGLVGLGNVGHRVAKFCRGFDMEVLAYDPYISPQVFTRHDVKASPSLSALLAQVDIVSVHTPLNHETTGMIGEELLRLLPRGSYVVNAARGGIIDEHALLACLQSGHLAGVAIDTWDEEPRPRAELAQHPRVWCSPHIGASTLEAQNLIGITIVEQVLKALAGAMVDYPINLPTLGVLPSALVASYVVLAEKLGSLAAQLKTSNPSKVELFYRGDLAGGDQSYIRLGWITGFTAHAVDGFVSFVNAAEHFAKLGLPLFETNDPNFHSYRSAITCVLSHEDGSTLTVGGVVFDETNLRISLIDEFCFEVEPRGSFLLIRNNDQPGVIGGVGSLLAEAEINIDSFNLSRLSQGGAALGLIKVDGAIKAQTLKELKELPYINEVHLVSF